jgi:polyferredoxin
MTPRGLVRVRHTVQWTLLILFVVVPFTGLFRIDAAAGRFLVAGYQIWWGDFFIVFPFWAMVFFTATAFYSTFGMIFCGWACPQHTLSELLNGLARRLLGRRVVAGLSPERKAVRSSKRLWPLVRAWGLFTGAVLALSAVLTVVVMAYFFPLPDLWAHFTGGRFNLYIAVFSLMLGTFVVVDLGLLRHAWCKYMCPYGLWQYMFHGRDTLQIRFDQTREGDCNRCTLCKDVCPVDLDPRQPEIYTRCINCGICIDACASYMGRFDKGPILSFGFGTRKAELVRITEGRSRARSPQVWLPVGAVALSASLFAYGVWTFEPVRLSVHQAQGAQADPGADGISYTAEILNKDDREQSYRVSVTGLPSGAVELPRAELSVAPGDTVAVPFRVRQRGLAYDRPYPFRVVVTWPDGGQAFATDSVYYLPDLRGG